MICCGEERATNYCPVCGRQLAEAPLVGLLSHCRVTARRIRATAVDWRRHATQRPDDDAIAATARKWEAAADKWEARTTALNTLLQTTEGDRDEA